MDPSEAFVTTVIPTFEEAEFIDRCLTSLMEQTWPSDRHSILVVDGGSKDATRTIVERLAKESADSGGVEISLIDNPERYVPQARNLAMKQLPEQTTHVFEMIGHVWLPRDHIEKRMQGLEEIVSDSPGKVAGVGTLVCESDEKLPMVGRWVEATLQNPMGAGRGQFCQFSGRERTMISPFTIYRKEALESIEGYDERFITTQDSELNMRLIDSGWELWRSDDSSCRMAKRRDLLGWIRFGHRYGFWRTKHLRMRPSRASPLEFLPWIGLLLTLGLLFIDVQAIPENSWMVPVVLYISVLLIHGLIECVSRRQPSLLFGVPLMLFLLHTSFSIGLLDGMVRKGRAPRDRVN